MQVIHVANHLSNALLKHTVTLFSQRPRLLQQLLLVNSNNHRYSNDNRYLARTISCNACTILFILLLLLRLIQRLLLSDADRHQLIAPVVAHNAVINHETSILIQKHHPYTGL